MAGDREREGRERPVVVLVVDVAEGREKVT